MSKTSSPGHRFSGAIDSFYDPEFTAQISSKMQVPDKISVVEGVENLGSTDYQPNVEKTIMQVPERILVAGGNGHIAARETPLELRLESSLPTEPAKSALTTPPRVLTLDEYIYPAIDAKPDSTNQVAVNSLASISEIDKSSFNYSRMPGEELLLLHQQVNLLNRRILVLERENVQRQQREMILYAIGIAYFVIKGLMWFHRHL